MGGVPPPASSPAPKTHRSSFVLVYTAPSVPAIRAVELKKHQKFIAACACAPKRGRLISAEDALAETRFQARDSPSVVYSGLEYTLPLACGRARREDVAVRGLGSFCDESLSDGEPLPVSADYPRRRRRSDMHTQSVRVPSCFVFRMSVFVDCSWSCESQGRLDFESTYRCLGFHRLCARWPSPPSIAAF